MTPIVDAGAFYEAEKYHQDYHIKQPERYKSYAYASGRIPYLKKIWGAGSKPQREAAQRKPGHESGWDKDAFVKPSDEELKTTLSPVQYRVTQHEGTERPFANEFWDNKEDGIYVDMIEMSRSVA